MYNKMGHSRLFKTIGSMTLLVCDRKVIGNKKMLIIKTKKQQPKLVSAYTIHVKSTSGAPTDL